jgi:hypothetical protein
VTHLVGISSLRKVLSMLTRKPMSCEEMSEATAVKGCWASTNHKTSANTLYSAILREMAHRFEEGASDPYSRRQSPLLSQLSTSAS